MSDQDDNTNAVQEDFGDLNEAPFVDEENIGFAELESEDDPEIDPVHEDEDDDGLSDFELPDEEE
ncbi:hypothetical protein JW978_00485 [Candidatus Dojkabacteria bacterium]|nr:hypothetical protein [Candidatus Dojkabacteria bacterium]